MTTPRREEESWGEVASLLARLKAISHRLAVVVVANLKSESRQAPNSLETEYLSQDELESVLLSFRSLGIFTQLFTSEDAFISSYLRAELDSIPRDLILIYNSAQAGSGPGRKALIPAFCQLHALATTGSNPYVVGLARHKFHVNCLLRAAGLPAPATWCYDAQSGWLLDRKPPTGTKVILKPTYESASIGIDGSSVITVDPGTDEIVKERSQALHQPLTVQTFVSGFEVEIPVVGLGQPFAPMVVGISAYDRQCLMDDILTFDLVFTDSYSFFPFDALSGFTGEHLKAIATRAFQLIGIEGIGRIDGRIDQSGSIFITDIATNPHITPHSSFAFAFRTRGLPKEAAPSLLVALGCHKAGWL